jgi:signal peptidase II
MDQAVPPAKPRFAFPSLQEHLLFWPLALGGLGLDLWTKHLAFQRLEWGQAYDIIPGLLRFHLALNRGAAFSMAWGSRGFLVTISGVALVVLLGVFFLGLSLTGDRRTTLTTVVLGLFVGGVAGNFYDRAFYMEGQVRDFIDMYVGPHHWPTYNVADALLCVAVGLLLIQSLFTGKQEPAGQAAINEDAPSVDTRPNDRIV